MILNSYRFAGCDLPSNALTLTGLDVDWERNDLISYKINPRLLATAASAGANVYVHVTASWANESGYNFTVLNNTTATGGLGINGATGRSGNEQVIEVSTLDTPDQGGVTGVDLMMLSYIARSNTYTVECDTGPLYLKLTPFIQCGTSLIAGTSQQTVINSTPFCPPCPRPSFTVNSYSAGWQTTSSGYDLIVTANITESSTIDGYWATFYFNDQASTGVFWTENWAGRDTYGATTTIPNNQGHDTWGKLLTKAELQAGYNISDQVSAIKNYTHCTNQPNWKVYVWPVVDCATDSVRYWPQNVTGNIPAMYTSVANANLCFTPPTTYNIFNFTNCSTGAAVMATDPSSYAPSVGDVVELTPSGGSAICATVTSSGTSATDPQTTITGTFTSCGECNATNFCHAPSDFSMTLSGGSYTSYSYRDVVQVASSGTINAVNIETKLTLESSLGSRAASDVLLSNYGQVTGLSISSGFVDFNFDGTGCFTNANETMMYRLKVECGDNSTGSWITHSTAYSSWSTVMIDHAGASQQCSSGGGGGGTLYQITECNSTTTHLVEDTSSYSPSSGDVVDFYDSSGNQMCGTITATGQSGNANGAYINNTGYTSCIDCNQQNYFPNPTLYTATDCNDSSTTYILDDQYGPLFPSTGDIVDVYLLNGNTVCVTITGTTSSGSAAGSIASSYPSCTLCNSANSLTVYMVQECNSDTVIVVSDTNGTYPVVGDVVSYYFNSSGNVGCGTIISETTGTGVADISSTWTDCAEASSYEGC